MSFTRAGLLLDSEDFEHQWGGSSFTFGAGPDEIGQIWAAGWIKLCMSDSSAQSFYAPRPRWARVGTTDETL